MSEEILADAAQRMGKAVDAFVNSIATIRTGRANTSLVEHLPVSHYGQTLPLNQLATLAAPDAQLITVQPWDRGAVDSVVRAIQQSDLGINPASDGVVIRLPIPPLTEERRRELVRQLGGKLEDSRVAVRNVRRHAVDGLRKELRSGELSEDEERREIERLERTTQEHVEMLRELAAEKERELLEV
ncbi:MAG: ribosome recycling factor [Chloroflexi bacterium]|nr:ribosome recycling factor [Chloroflexota bacterium]